MISIKTEHEIELMKELEKQQDVLLKKMVKNKIVLSDNDKYMDYLDNITD